MIRVNLYEPKKINADIEFPTAWNDLHTPELHFIAKTLLAQTPETAITTRPKILKFILQNRVKAAKVKLGNFFYRLEDEILVLQGFPLLDFIFEKNDLTNLPDPVRFRFRTYYPVPWHEITCAEYEDCEVLSSQFASDPKIETLAEMAAILLRPRRDKEALTPYMIYEAATDTYKTYPTKKKHQFFRKLPPQHLYAILIWYAGSRAVLPKIFPMVYGKGGGNNPGVFTDVIHSGAGPKNGTRNQIRTTRLYEFLYECNQEAAKAKELEEEYKRQKK